MIKGYAEAKRLLKRYKPDVVFSKGGFVAVPVVLAAKHYKIPTIIHESDMTPGLANKICIPSAARVCCNFPETMKYLPADKAVLTGSPIRAELLKGERTSGLAYAHLKEEKPVLLIIGAVLGLWLSTPLCAVYCPVFCPLSRSYISAVRAIWMNLSSAPRDMCSMSM